ncbi:hypothetical protein ACFYMI_01885 [Streptomyces collinus]|uniref:hypothetical protein n=1 Tax=Streptomyces collinus TaxID=42684 RepID=UPI00368753C8
MTAEHGEDGYDEVALMAVLTGEAPPDDALADDAFMTEYRSATADVALLREQLGLIGEALAGPEPVPGHVPEQDPDHVPAQCPEPGPGAGGGASVTSLSARRGRRKPWDLALKGLVAAVGAGLVIGMGWLVVQSGGMDTGSDQGASSAADGSAGREHAQGDAKLSHAGYLACARIVVEGIVTEVETVPGTGQDRITLDVTRYYKPDKGRARITFPLETGAVPSLRAGEHMLVGISGEQAHPDTWATGEKEIARERAWITAALPASRTLPCP